jgi:inner membrane protein
VITVILVSLIIAASLLIIGFHNRHRLSKQLRSDSLHGKIYLGRVLTLAMPVINGMGVIDIENTVWRVKCIDLPAGSRIKIIGINGFVLQAEPHQG